MLYPSGLETERIGRRLSISEDPLLLGVRVTTQLLVLGTCSSPSPLCVIASHPIEFVIQN